MYKCQILAYEVNIGTNCEKFEITEHDSQSYEVKIKENCNDLLKRSERLILKNVISVQKDKTVENQRIIMKNGKSDIKAFGFMVCSKPN